MRCDIKFIFSATQELDLQLNMEPDPAQVAASQQWLQQKWEELECEPLRASGKVLLLDRILGVTDALGYHYLQSRPQELDTLARHCLRALGTAQATVDLPGLTVRT